MSAIAAATSAPLFYLFKSPRVVAPSYELGRLIGNGFFGYLYFRMIETGHTRENFEKGVRTVGFWPISRILSLL